MFGAQVIIVRSQQAKAEAKKQFATALVMTVEECKGLEFSDAFLFNFFHDASGSTALNCFAGHTCARGARY
eukprot:2127755-Rhodomonas_salina.2